MTAMVLVSLLSGAPVADVWPWKVERLPDGSYEYWYDLAPLESVRGSADARLQHGAEAVDAFVKRLPKSVKLRVGEVRGLVVSAGRGAEPRPLAKGFGGISDAPIRSGNPLERQAAPLLRMPLHPDEPKVLLSADAALWAARAVEDGVQNAVLREVAAARRALLEAVFAQAVKRSQRDEGDLRDGAVALSARLAAALSCLNKGRAPTAVKTPGLLADAFESELRRLEAHPDARAVPRPFAATPDVACAFVAGWVMGQPLPESRASNAAALLFIALVDKDPAFTKRYQLIRQRRDAYFGAPAREPLDAWRAAAGADPEGAIDRLADFLERLPYDLRTAPVLMAMPATPFSAFQEQLSARERVSSGEELAAAIIDGRLQISAGSDVPWPALHEGALTPLLASDAAGVQFDASWRDRLVGTFAALVGSHHEVQADGAERDTTSEERSELKVRLMVPPLLLVEPIAPAFARQAASLERLGRQLAADTLGGLLVLWPDGRAGPASAATEVARWSQVLAGLASLANPHSRQIDTPQARAARAFLAGWRREGPMKGDVRSIGLSALHQGDDRLHTAVVGVARRELVVTFTNPPAMTLPAGPFVADSTAEQRYVLPVLATTATVQPATLPTSSRVNLLQALDAVNGDPLRVEGAVLEALSRARESSKALAPWHP